MTATSVVGQSHTGRSSNNCAPATRGNGPSIDISTSALVNSSNASTSQASSTSDIKVQVNDSSIATSSSNVRSVGQGQVMGIAQVQAQAQLQAVSQSVHGSGGVANGTKCHSAAIHQGQMQQKPHVSSPSKVGGVAPTGGMVVSQYQGIVKIYFNLF